MKYESRGCLGPLIMRRFIRRREPQTQNKHWGEQFGPIPWPVQGENCRGSSTSRIPADVFSRISRSHVQFHSKAKITNCKAGISAYEDEGAMKDVFGRVVISQFGQSRVVECPESRE